MLAVATNMAALANFGFLANEVPTTNDVVEPMKQCLESRRPADDRWKMKGSKIMTFGISTDLYTFAHVVISLVAIFSGFVVVFGLLASKRLDGWTALFLAATVATSVTGFGFPFDHFMPSHGVGIISLVVLAVAIFARYSRHLAGAWRNVFVVSSVVALYLNVFVAIVQAFVKVPALKVMAPTQSEPPFVVAQLVAMAVFVLIAIVAAIRFHVEADLRA
jgi:hypothetical protein